MFFQEMHQQFDCHKKLPKHGLPCYNILAKPGSQDESPPQETIGDTLVTNPLPVEHQYEMGMVYQLCYATVEMLR